MGLHCILAPGHTNGRGSPDQCFQIINVLEFIYSIKKLSRLQGRKSRQEWKVNMTSRFGHTAAPVRERIRPLSQGPLGAACPSLSAVLSPEGGRWMKHNSVLLNWQISAILGGVKTQNVSSHCQQDSNLSLITLVSLTFSW